MKKSIIFKIFCAVLCVALTCVTFSACGNTDIGIIGGEDGPEVVVTGEPMENTKVKFEMECDGKSMGSFVIEVYPEYAPITAANFVMLVEQGFYDGLIFHRVVDDFMAQGGAPKGESAAAIKGEFAANGVNNPLADNHERGVVSMARTNDPNSASSQFFICYSDTYSSSLDGNYAAFGKVIEGMQVVDSFLDVPRTYNSFDSKPATPTVDIVITSATVVE